MAQRLTDPHEPARPPDRVVHDTLLTWFTTPGLQDSLRTRDREAVETVLDLLRRRLRDGARAATRPDSRGRQGRRGRDGP